MQQIIYFFQKFKYFLFFLFLEFLALAITLNNLSFHNSKFLNSANFFSGGFYQNLSNITDYLKLKEENILLEEENTKLKNLLSKQNHFLESSFREFQSVDSLKYYQKYRYISAKIINNNYNSQFNFLTINKGNSSKIDKESAVFNSKGIIGITESVTRKYTRVQSILNRDSKINARLKNTNYFGTLVWDGKNSNVVQLLDIPRQAAIKIGDSIETDGKSSIFPEGIPIGKVIEIFRGNSAENKIDIQLFNDMTNLGHVYVVKNFDKIEIKELERDE